MHLSLICHTLSTKQTTLLHQKTKNHNFGLVSFFSFLTQLSFRALSLEKVEMNLNTNNPFKKEMKKANLFGLRRASDLSQSLGTPLQRLRIETRRRGPRIIIPNLWSGLSFFGGRSGSRRSRSSLRNIQRRRGERREVERAIGISMLRVREGSRGRHGCNQPYCIRLPHFLIKPQNLDFGVHKRTAIAICKQLVVQEIKNQAQSPSREGRWQKLREKGFCRVCVLWTWTGSRLRNGAFSKMSEFQTSVK